MAEIIPFRPRGEPGLMRYRQLWLQRLDRLQLDLDGMAGPGMEMVPPDRCASSMNCGPNARHQANDSRRGRPAPFRHRPR